jgi:hypothetical protein
MIVVKDVIGDVVETLMAALLQGVLGSERDAVSMIVLGCAVVYQK